MGDCSSSYDSNSSSAKCTHYHGKLPPTLQACPPPTSPHKMHGTHQLTCALLCEVKGRIEWYEPMGTNNTMGFIPTCRFHGSWDTNTHHRYGVRIPDLWVTCTKPYRCLNQLAEAYSSVYQDLSIPNSILFLVESQPHLTPTMSCEQVYVIDF